MGKLTNKIRRSIATKLSLGIVLMAIPVFVICVGLLFVLSLLTGLSRSVCNQTYCWS